MATNPTFQLFSSSQGSGLGLGFHDSQDPALPPPPPPVEVLSSEASSSVDLEVDKVTIGEITLLKGRVSTKEVFGLPNSDLEPGVYEGSIDLVKALEKESHTGTYHFLESGFSSLDVVMPSRNLCVSQVGEIRFFAGEWSEVHQVLSLVNNDGETNKKGGYDIILMAETIYSVSAQKSLYELIKRCLAYPDGAVYMAAKKYYFGVGGGTR